MAKKVIFFIFILPYLVIVGCTSNSTKTSQETRAMLYYSQGTQDLVDKNFTSALQKLLEANKIWPNNSKILNNLGMAYYFKEHPDLAKQSYIDALKADADNCDARNNLATIYLQEKKYDQALAEYNKIRTYLTYKDQFRVLFNLATISHHKGHQEEALNLLVQSLSDNEHFCPSHLLMGDIYTQMKNHKKAYQSYLDASKGACYEYPVPHYKQAITLIELNEYLKAKEKLLFIIERYPKTSFAPRAQKKLGQLTPRVILGLDNVDNNINDPILELPPNSIMEFQQKNELNSINTNTNKDGNSFISPKL